MFFRIAFGYDKDKLKRRGISRPVHMKLTLQVHEKIMVLLAHIFMILPAICCKTLVNLETNMYFKRNTVRTT